MADIRNTIGGMGGGRSPSRIPGTAVGVQFNSFGLKKLASAVNGEVLSRLALEAMQPAKEMAQADWPVWTGASKDTIRLEVMEVGPTNSRVALTAGGEQLVQDPRNEKHIDYVPFIEFNGTKTAPPGILVHSIIIGEPQKVMHRLVSELIAGIANG